MNRSLWWAPALVLAGLLSLGLLLTGGRTAGAAPRPPLGAQNTCTIQFTDVPTGTYFYDAVLWLACRGDVSGYNDGSFQPYNTTTRGQLTKIVVLAYGLPLRNPPSGHFSDVPPGAPFYPYVETAYAAGIVSGYGDGTFRPGDLVTRGQIAKMITLTAGWTPVNPASGHFSDVPPGSPYFQHVETAVAHGILSGYGDGTFRPYSPALRGQVSKIVYLAIATGCAFFPSDNIWNRDISNLPVDPLSATYVASMGASGTLHAGFGSGTYQGEPIGIPWIAVPTSQPAVTMTFGYYQQSDAGPYPVPTNAPIQGGPTGTGDRHVLVVAQGGACTLYEMFAATPQADGSWVAGSGARWDLGSDALRPDGWTSANAAGLPLLPGLVRYAEVTSGAINHALLVTANNTQAAHIWPARHDSGVADPTLPPMGTRLRLKADVDLSGYPPADQVILRALQHYGMFVADNGDSWALAGTQDERWDNDTLHLLNAIPGGDFEVVDESSLMIDPDSGRSR